jgi:hypothetical protein
MTMLKLPSMTAASLILAALLTSPAPAKDYSSMKDYTAGRASHVSAATGAADDGRMWLAIKSVQCGSTRVVLWREVNDAADYYATSEHRVRGTFPRVKGKFTYNDDTGKTSLNGKQCKDAR